jgi:lysophospholipase L1-like esterase
VTPSTEPAAQRPIGRGAAWIGTAALAIVSVALALTGADLVVRTAELNFSPLRSRANDDSVLDRVEFRTRVVTNALGFRDPRLPGPKPAGTVRVVVLGDSFTQGYGVEEEEAYPRRLERLLNQRRPGTRHEVINLGVPGACPLDYDAHLEEVGLAYEPDVVVVGLMANDVSDIYSKREYGSRIMSEVLRQVQEEAIDDRPRWKRLPQRLWPSLYEYAGAMWAGLRARSAGAAVQGEPPKAAAKAPAADVDWNATLLALAARYGRRAEIEAALPEMPPAQLEALRPVLTGEYQYTRDRDQEPMFRLAAFLRPRANADMVLLPPDYDAAWAVATRKLRRIDTLARGADARTMIAFLPAAFQVSPEAWRRLRGAGFEMDPALLTDTTMSDRLRAFGAAEGIPVVDLLPPLRARHEDALYYPLDGHWTPLGHGVAAEELADAILRR